MSIIKGFYKIAIYLTEEQAEQLENYAVQHDKFFKISFKIILIDPKKKELLISAKQGKHGFKNPYLTAGEIIGKTKKLFSEYFPQYHLKVSTTEYHSPKSEEITPQKLQTLIQHHKIKIKNIHTDTGLEISNLSAWINGTRPMSNIVKNMFYYYFKSLELSK